MLWEGKEKKKTFIPLSSVSSGWSKNLIEIKQIKGKIKFYFVYMGTLHI